MVFITLVNCIDWVKKQKISSADRILTALVDSRIAFQICLYSKLVIFVPLSMSLVCFLLLIFSLWKHLRKMQFNGKRSEEPSTKVHIKAIKKTPISFLFLFAIYFLSVVISA
nr:taste receptor type 2 member 19-like [Loxodonta africana]